MYKMNLLKLVRKGFTLIELLVVVAIIALLLAILVPSLRAAQKRAQAVVCRTNLRNCAHGAMLYAASHNSQFPAYRNQTDMEFLSRPGWYPDLGWDCPSKWTSVRGMWEMNMMGGTNDCIFGRSEAALYPKPRYDMDIDRKLTEYVDEESFRCPADDGVTLRPNDPSRYEYIGSSYLYNGAFMNSAAKFDWALHGKSTHEASHPLTYIFADMTMWYAFPYYIWNVPEGFGPHGTQYFWHDPPEDHPGELAGMGVSLNPWALWYAPKSNVAFVDGHVEFLQLGPYGTGDYRINTSNYVVVPDHTDPDYVPP